MTDDYDSPWKQVLELYFQEFTAFFLPQIHTDVDWTRKPESLDTELQKIIRSADTGRRLADKLMKVWRLDGAEQIVLIHIEVQGEVDTTFVERMFVYHYRLFDAYRKPIVSIAVLGDESDSWRPQCYQTELWGCETLLRFPVIKLTDYNDHWQSLEASTNPFATMVMAHLKTKSTRHDPLERMGWKLHLVKRLYEKGFQRNDVVELFGFIDWLLHLPPELEQQFTEQLSDYEAAMSNPYITSIERQGIKKGFQQGIEQGQRQILLHQTRSHFGVATAESLAPLLEQIHDTAKLTEISEWFLECETGAALLEKVRALTGQH